MIKNDKFEQSLLNEIKTKKIIPKPKWHFLLKDYVVWAAGLVSVIVGGLAFSVIIYLLRYNDWDIYGQVSGNILGFILITLPYFWLILLIIFIFIIFYNVKHTKKGYRYSMPVIIVGSIVVSIILGGLFYGVGLGRAIDDILGERVGFYPKIFNQQIDFWSRPEEGRLTGLIVDRPALDTLTLFDLEQREWEVKIKDIGFGETMEMPIGGAIRIMGKQLSEKVFMAERIMPVMPGRGMFKRHRDRFFPCLDGCGGPAERPGKIKDFPPEPEKFYWPEN